MGSESKLICYNRGCGKMYSEKDNNDDSCIHHPGAPFFHDAYKGWSCCKKKCTDFTEFLNIKGCTHSKHSNLKREEPQPSNAGKHIPREQDQIPVPKPLKLTSLERPPFESPLIRLKTTISATLQQELEKMKPSVDVAITEKSGNTVGTPCINGGCKETYVNESSNDTICSYHPGVPIFHEGLKYWTCCTRRTTDFQAFLNQEGCTTGSHVWKSKNDQKSSTGCRYDWMQTGTRITVNFYCKMYDPRDASLTFVEVNPVRLRVQIYFPTNGAFYKNDLELHGVIDTVASQVIFTPTKVEIGLKKAEPMTWSRLHVPRPVCATAETSPVLGNDDNLPKVDVLDLSDL